MESEAAVALEVLAEGMADISLENYLYSWY
jgi:hypothetical protein